MAVCLIAGISAYVPGSASEPACKTGASCTATLAVEMGGLTKDDCTTALTSSYVMLTAGTCGTGLAVAGSVTASFASCTSNTEATYSFSVQTPLARATAYKMCWCKSYDGSSCTAATNTRPFKVDIGGLHINGR